MEIKCPFSATHAKYIINNRLPAEYRAQIQGSLWVTGREWWDFISFDPRVKDRPFWKFRVERDEEYIGTLRSAVDIFIDELKDLESKIIKNFDF